MLSSCGILNTYLKDISEQNLAIKIKIYQLLNDVLDNLSEAAGLVLLVDVMNQLSDHLRVRLRLEPIPVVD